MSNPSWKIIPKFCDLLRKSELYDSVKIRMLLQERFEPIVHSVQGLTADTYIKELGQKR